MNDGTPTVVDELRQILRDSPTAARDLDTLAAYVSGHCIGLAATLLDEHPRPNDPGVRLSVSLLIHSVIQHATQQGFEKYILNAGPIYKD
jgi:hypothetical protein